MTARQQSASGIGIAGLGLFLPTGRVTSSEIAQASGLPLDVIEEKMGILEKPRAGPEDHASTMALHAARDALGDTDPAELDLIIYTGSMHKDHYVWSAAAKVQELLGARHAYAFETVSLCSTNVLTLKVAKDLMTGDPALRTVLLCGGHRTADLIDYGNPRTRFLFSLSDGGSAILLRRDLGRNAILGSAFITDGRFADDVRMPAGGSRLPASRENVRKNLHTFDIPDVERFKQRMDEVSADNFLAVVRESLARSGLDESDIDFLCINHMKRSFHDFVLKELGLAEDQAIYLSDIGHIGAPDQVVALKRALDGGRLADGDLVVLAAAGLGFTWGSTVVRWGPVEE
ncbi:MAG: 3-oxoacyl-ACP synthase [Actinomycetota bacterium]